MAKQTGSTATENEGTTGKRTRRSARRTTARRRTMGTAGISASTSTGDRYLNTFNSIVGALRSLDPQQRPQMLELCNRFVAQNWHGAQTGHTTEVVRQAAIGATGGSY